MRLCGRSIRGSLVTIAVLVTGAVAGFCSQPALAGRSTPLHEKKHDAKRQVEALEEQWRTAQLAGDVDAMDRLLADDYIGISMSGQVTTKTQQLDRARSRKLVLTRLDLGEMQIKLVGSIAIVTSRVQVEGTNDGMPVQGTFRYTRVYQRLPSGVWKITSFEATRVPESGGFHGNPSGEAKPDKAPPAEPSPSPPSL
jgi:ketosteroid isomerase-like protein